MALNPIYQPFWQPLCRAVKARPSKTDTNGPFGHLTRLPCALLDSQSLPFSNRMAASPCEGELDHYIPRACLLVLPKPSMTQPDPTPTTLDSRCMSFPLTGDSRAEPICPGIAARPVMSDAATNSWPTCVTQAIWSRDSDIASFLLKAWLPRVRRLPILRFALRQAVAHASLVEGVDGQIGLVT